MEVWGGSYGWKEMQLDLHQLQDQETSGFVYQGDNAAERHDS